MTSDRVVRALAAAMVPIAWGPCRENQKYDAARMASLERAFDALKTLERAGFVIIPPPEGTCT